MNNPGVLKVGQHEFYGQGASGKYKADPSYSRVWDQVWGGITNPYTDQLGLTSTGLVRGGNDTPVEMRNSGPLMMDLMRQPSIFGNENRYLDLFAGSGEWNSLTGKPIYGDAFRGNPQRENYYEYDPSWQTWAEQARISPNIPWHYPDMTTGQGQVQGTGNYMPQTQRDQFGQPMGGSGATLYSPTMELGGGMSVADAARQNADIETVFQQGAQDHMFYEGQLNNLTANNGWTTTNVFQPQQVQGYTYQPQIATTTWGVNNPIVDQNIANLNPQNNPQAIWV